MFTGIIKEVGRVQSTRALEGAREMTVDCDLAAQLHVDQSVNINGVCHTVTEAGGSSFTVQSVEETLRKTAIGKLGSGDPVNLEQSLRSDQLLDGHLVQGHVDTTGRIAAIKQEGDDRLFSISYDEAFRDLIVARGSISIDGISLTVASEEDSIFIVTVIPYTFHHTTMRERTVEDSVNLEFDILGKYVVRYLKNVHPSS
jgi:riboflavin synthase